MEEEIIVNSVEISDLACDFDFCRICKFIFAQIECIEMEDILMNEQVKDYVGKYSSEIIDMYNNLRQLIFESALCEPEETMWAKLPSYYVGESVVRLIPFKDHINIEAKAIILHKDELTGYKITPKGMLQIYLKQDIPYDVLKQIFTETLK